MLSSKTEGQMFLLFQELARPWLDITVRSILELAVLSTEELEVKHIYINDHRQPIELTIVPGLAVLSSLTLHWPATDCGPGSRQSSSQSNLNFIFLRQRILIPCL